MELATLKDFLAVVGGVALLVGPLLRSYTRTTIHGALRDAPTIIDLQHRMATLEATVAAHANDVRVVPQLAAILERMEETLNELNTTLRERVAKLEGAK